MTAPTSICAKYKSIDGWHVFQSDDLPGLYVASRDAERAFNDVATSIQMLVKLDEGIDCDVRPEMSYSEFVEAVRAESDEGMERAPLVMTSKRYVLTSLAA